MRVKFLIALAIASVLLLCSVGAALADLTGTTMAPTAEDLTNSALQDTSGIGFPDLTAANAPTVEEVENESAVPVVEEQNEAIVPTVEEVQNEAAVPISKKQTPEFTGALPDSTVNEQLTNIPGPVVSINNPELHLLSAPVELTNPVLEGSFAPIIIAPEEDVVVPQVDADLNSFDINPPFIDP